MKKPYYNLKGELRHTLRSSLYHELLSMAPKSASDSALTIDIHGCVEAEHSSGQQTHLLLSSNRFPCHFSDRRSHSKLQDFLAKYVGWETPSECLKS